MNEFQQTASKKIGSAHFHDACRWQKFIQRSQFSIRFKEIWIPVFSVGASFLITKKGNIKTSKRILEEIYKKNKSCDRFLIEM